jgi:hypothetical protein
VTFRLEYTGFEACRHAIQSFDWIALKQKGEAAQQDAALVQKSCGAKMKPRLRSPEGDTVL